MEIGGGIEDLILLCILREQRNLKHDDGELSEKIKKSKSFTALSKVKCFEGVGYFSLHYLETNTEKLKFQTCPRSKTAYKSEYFIKWSSLKRKLNYLFYCYFCLDLTTHIFFRKKCYLFF